MEVLFTPKADDFGAMRLQILWRGRLIHTEEFQQPRALTVAQLFAQDGYPVTWVTSQGYRVVPSS